MRFQNSPRAPNRMQINQRTWQDNYTNYITNNVMSYGDFIFYKDLESNETRIRDKHYQLIITLDYVLDFNDKEKIDILLLLI